MAMSEGSESYALPITNEGVVRLVPRLRERYLTQQVSDAIVQATGHVLRIWIWSDRSNVCVKLPFDGFRAERPYVRSINSWGVNVNRWTTPGKQSGTTGWNNDAELDVGYGGDSGKPMVEATVETFEGVKPDV